MALRRRKSGIKQAVDQAVDQAIDFVGSALDDAREAAAPMLNAAQDRAADVAENIGVGAKPKKKHRLRKVLVLAGLGGVAALVVKKLQGGTSDNWQSSYTPTPPAAPAAPAETVDPAGASPDEAIADASETPNPVSTPDEPATVVELDPDQPA